MVDDCSTVPIEFMEYHIFSFFQLLVSKTELKTHKLIGQKASWIQGSLGSEWKLLSFIFLCFKHLFLTHLLAHLEDNYLWKQSAVLSLSVRSLFLKAKEDLSCLSILLIQGRSFCLQEQVICESFKCNLQQTCQSDSVISTCYELWVCLRSKLC